MHVYIYIYIYIYKYLLTKTQKIDNNRHSRCVQLSQQISRAEAKKRKHEEAEDLINFENMEQLKEYVEQDKIDEDAAVEVRDCMHTHSYICAHCGVTVYIRL